MILKYKVNNKKSMKKFVNFEECFRKTILDIGIT